MIRIERLTGRARKDALPEVAHLRIKVFRDWPYLYDGDLAYEEAYLQSYRDSDNAILVGAFYNGVLVGASTGAPLEEYADEFGAAFEAVDVPMHEVFYCAESVLLPSYRGQGIGHSFFDVREAHARELGRRYSTFCGVVRPEDHPLRTSDYRPLDTYWHKRGYAPVTGLVAKFIWKDIDQPDETQHCLQFWMRQL